MTYKKIDDTLSVIDIEKSTKREIEKHFFRAGYGYALTHFKMAVENLKINSKLEEKILKYMDFLGEEK